MLISLLGVTRGKAAFTALKKKKQERICRSPSKAHFEEKVGDECREGGALPSALLKLRLLPHFGVTRAVDAECGR